MKKILTILLFLTVIIVSGCVVNNEKFTAGSIPNNLKLKAQKDKILKYKERTIYHRELVNNPIFGGDTASTTDTIIDNIEYILVPEVIVEYDYISENIATNNVYYDKENKSFSNAEILEKKNKKVSIAFYSENLWFKDNGFIYDIVKGATTTPEIFNKETSLTFLDKIKDFILPTAYAIDTYTSNGTYTPTSAGNVEVLVVAGGGGGGTSNRTAGGGGGGGYQYDASFAVTAQEYSVTVGDGGATNVNGENSVFSTITALGGGGGGGYPEADGSDGGSGGGARHSAEAGTGSQGGDGGTGYSSGVGGQPFTGGGGGGANENGDNGIVTHGGNGGDGISNSISGSAVTYAGGGGGGIENDTTVGAGGAGGGGAGSADNAIPVNGTDNLGGGGGGCGGTYGQDGGVGGSGVVIIVAEAGVTAQIF